jgi:hypothetical protein
MNTNPRLTTTQAKQNLDNILERVITDWARGCLNASLGFEDVLGLAGSDDVSDRCYKTVEGLEHEGQPEVLERPEPCLVDDAVMDSPCDACGQTVNVLEHPTWGEKLCPKCATRDLLRNAAMVHLNELLEPVVLAWGKHWTVAGVELKDLGVIACELHEQVKTPADWLEQMDSEPAGNHQ